MLDSKIPAGFRLTTTSRGPAGSGRKRSFAIDTQCFLEFIEWYVKADVPSDVEEAANTDQKNHRHHNPDDISDHGICKRRVSLFEEGSVVIFIKFSAYRYRYNGHRRIRTVAN